MLFNTSFIIFISLFSWSVSANQNQDKSKDKNQNVEKRYESLKTFSDVLYIVEKSYIKEVPAEALIEGAIKGMLKELDPHSVFLSEDRLKNFKESARGQFNGLGVELTIKDKQPVILSVLENSPAYKAGVKAGQVILKINNKKTFGLNGEEIYEMLISSRRGQKFTIVVKDPKSKKIHEIKLKSQIISFQSVVYKDLGDEFIYIRINAFTDRTLQEIQKILNKYKKMAGLLLDLRGNPGGVFDSSVKVANLFIKEGVIVSIKGRVKDYEQVFKAHPSSAFLYFPMFVLIDTYSASAAEVLAGALKDNKRAVLLGRKSFGKGSVQSLIPVSKEKAIKLTVAHYYTPSGESIHEKGIKPHIEFQRPQPSDEQTGVIFTSKEDTDFQKALSFMKMLKYLKSTSDLPSGL